MELVPRFFFWGGGVKRKLKNMNSHIAVKSKFKIILCIPPHLPNGLRLLRSLPPQFFKNTVFVFICFCFGGGGHVQGHDLLYAMNAPTGNPSTVLMLLYSSGLELMTFINLSMTR